jgi:energy-coupling factor transporter transmembrane protein EcfT
MTCVGCSAKHTTGGAGGATHVRSFLFYIPVDSPARRVNPLTKLIVVLLVSTVAFAVENPYVNVPLLIVVCVALALMGISFKSLKMIVLMMSGLLLVTTCAQLLFSTIPGEVRYMTFPWGTYVSERTLPYILLFYIRFLTASLVNLLFFCTTRESELMTALRTVRLPYIACFIVTFALRVMALLLDEWWAIVDAQRARGMDFQGSISERLDKLGRLLMLMLSSTLRRVDTASYALLARGFVIDAGPRTQLRSLTWNRYDVALLVPALSVSVALLVARYGFGCFTLG